ncbi:MAG: inorganic diphosphatase, partial [Clostridia bacterium]|nr:inorganic diphosphatase [Clostridia bacterium]
DLSDLPAHISEEISHFFNVYKHLEPSREAQVKGVFCSDEAVEVIKQAF